MTKSTDKSLSTKTGSVLSEGAYLDEHFQACKPEYESMLRGVGLESGWRVLDAGCGSGSFLPLMSELLGKNGQIDALDLASENIAIVDEQIAQNSFICPVLTKVGSVAQLPYKDNLFDAVWCANITQYFTDDELRSILSEFQRVLKPDGILAIKDFSMMCMQWQPLDPLLLSRLLQSQVDANKAYQIQLLRNASLAKWVRHVGFTNVSAKTTMTERMQPLRDVERSFFGSLIEFNANKALTEKQVSKPDLDIWEKLLDVKSPDHILFHPDFYYSEGHIVVTAKKP